MNSILPIEISNIIYSKRAIYRLKDICQIYSLDFDKFCSFLIENNTILAGSCAVACYDTECEFNDMDLFVFTKPNVYPNIHYKKFLNVFAIDQSLVTIDKQPVSNSICEEQEECQPHYFYKFKYLDKTIDMLIIPESASNVVNNYTFFNLSKIFFDGVKFNIPFKNIEFFLDHRYCMINNPYHTFWDEIYDPWHFGIEQEINKCTTKFILQGKDIKNPKMGQVYNEYKKYYNLDEGTLLFNDSDSIYEIFKGYCEGLDTQHVLTGIEILKMVALSIKMNNSHNYLDVFKKVEYIQPDFEEWVAWEADTTEEWGLESKRIAQEITRVEYNKEKDVLLEKQKIQFEKEMEKYEKDLNKIITEKQKYELLHQLYKTYKGVYKILSYIEKGYVMLNIDKFF